MLKAFLILLCICTPTLVWAAFPNSGKYAGVSSGGCAGAVNLSLGCAQPMLFGVP